MFATNFPSYVHMVDEALLYDSSAPLGGKPSLIAHRVSCRPALAYSIAHKQWLTALPPHAAGLSTPASGIPAAIPALPAAAAPRRQRPGRASALPPSPQPSHRTCCSRRPGGQPAGG
jgi:hypothetical protein